MKTILFASLLFLSIGIMSNQIAFGEKINSTITLDGNEIRYEAVNVKINDVKFDKQSLSLVLNITSDKTLDGSITLFMQQEQVNALFSPGPLCKIQSPWMNQLFLLVDGEEKDFELSGSDLVTTKFEIPAGSTTVEMIGSGVIGQETGPKFIGIPEFDIYKPGQQINLNGVLENYCGNVIPDAKIDFKVKNMASLSQGTTTDSLGKFTLNFTIPQDSESGRYKATLYGIKENVNAIWISTILVQKDGESNTPFILDSPEFGSFKIPYHLENGEIIDISANFGANSVSVYYSANQNKTLEIKFPKRLMDFVGKINQIYPLCDSKCAAYLERLDPDYRIFEIPVTEGAHYISLEGLKFGKDPSLDREGVYPLSIENMVYPIPYDITGGSLNEITADITTKTLNVYVYSPSPTGGHLRLELPRNVIDSLQGNADKEFLVVNYDRTGKEKSTGYKESKSDLETRILELNFTRDRNYIHITGTWIIPEFPFAQIMLLTSMGLLVVFYKMKLGK